MIDFPLELGFDLTERGAAGVPTTTRVRAPLRRGLQEVEWSISDQAGFESARITRLCNVEEGVAALRDWLGRGLVITGPEGNRLWEGYLDAVEVEIGGQTRSRSLATVANTIAVAYEAGGASLTYYASDADSIARWGYLFKRFSFDNTTTANVVQKAARLLAERATPRTERRDAAASGAPAAGGGARVSLTFRGWYGTLDRYYYGNNTTTDKETTEQVQDILAAHTSTVGAFLSSDQSQIAASGYSTSQYVPSDGTHREAIESRLAWGSSSYAPLAWGVYERRRFHVAVSAQADPATIHYRRTVGDGRIRSATGAWVPWWEVRPNRMLETRELHDPQPGDAIDGAGRSYIARTTFRASRSGYQLDLEGANGESLAKMLARGASYGA